MKFRSPTEHPVQLALTTGHTCVIGVEMTEVDKKFHRMAIMQGCLPEGVEPEQIATENAPSKDDMILAAVRQIAQAGDHEDALGDGRPKVEAVSKLAGFTVSAADRDAAWAVVTDDA